MRFAVFIFGFFVASVSWGVTVDHILGSYTGGGRMNAADCDISITKSGPGYPWVGQKVDFKIRIGNRDLELPEQWERTFNRALADADHGQFSIDGPSTQQSAKLYSRWHMVGHLFDKSSHRQNSGLLDYITVRYELFEPWCVYDCERIEKVEYTCPVHLDKI